MNNYEKSYHKKKHNYLLSDINYYNIRALVAREDYFKGISQDDLVLEFGCGLGQNIYLIRNAVGYDFSKFAVDFCVKKKGINAVSSLDKIKDKVFDVVLACEVLEHVEKPLETLKVIRSKLRQGGKLILVLPIEKPKIPELSDTNQHLYSWSFQSITNLLIRAGFSPTYYKTIRRTGFKKWMFLWEMGLSGIYYSMTYLSAILSGSKHMKIIAIKNGR